MSFPKLKSRSIKINRKQLKKILNNLLLITVHHLFLGCLTFFLFALILGAILFYKYNILAQRTEREILGKPVLLKEDTYQEVLKVWQEQERRFEEADTKEYLDPFKKPVVVLEEEKLIIIPEEGGLTE